MVINAGPILPISHYENWSMLEIMEHTNALLLNRSTTGLELGKDRAWKVFSQQMSYTAYQSLVADSLLCVFVR
jgi:hypothetical protein